MKAIFLMVMAIAVLSFTNREPAEYKWNKDYKVQLKDFQLDPTLPPSQLAQINTGMVYEEKMKGDAFILTKPVFKAVAIANRQFSKVSPKVYNGYRQQEILEHEQLHFDIAEYVTRRTNIALEGVKDKNMRINIFNQYLDSLALVQMVFDAQTDHSNDMVWQHKWRKNIDSLLSGQKPLTDWKMYP